MKLSRDFKLHTTVPKDPVPFLSHDTARQQSHELAKDAQRKVPGPLAQNTTGVGLPCTFCEIAWLRGFGRESPSNRRAR